MKDLLGKVVLLNLHLMMRRGRKTAKVAMPRKLAVRLYWMMR
jgi:hypothetical protein